MLNLIIKFTSSSPWLLLGLERALLRLLHYCFRLSSSQLIIKFVMGFPRFTIHRVRLDHYDFRFNLIILIRDGLASIYNSYRVRLDQYQETALAQIFLISTLQMTKLKGILKRQSREIFMSFLILLDRGEILRPPVGNVSQTIVIRLGWSRKWICLLTRKSKFFRKYFYLRVRNYA
jgi:hypothetical protein